MLDEGFSLVGERIVLDCTFLQTDSGIKEDKT